MIFYRISRRLQKSLRWLLGFFHAHVTLNIICLLRLPIKNINRFERKIPFIERKEYAQNYEDGIIHALFKKVGTTNKYFVEFGVEDGMECNTRYLSKHKGWKGLLMDGSHQNPNINLQQEFITRENIEELFAKHNVPNEFDLLSIDIDGNDYWVWEAIESYTPRVVIMEYNACFDANESKTVPYDPSFMWDKTDYMGATLKALMKLGEKKGYTLIGTDSCGVNAFFVRDDLAHHFALGSFETLYHPAAYKGKKGLKHPKDPKDRPWVEI